MTWKTRLQNLEILADKFPPDENTSGWEDLCEYRDRPETIGPIALVTQAGESEYIKAFDSVEDAESYASDGIGDNDWSEGVIAIANLEDGTFRYLQEVKFIWGMHENLTSD